MKTLLALSIAVALLVMPNSAVSAGMFQGQQATMREQGLRGLVKGNSTFAVDLYGLLRKQEGNVCFSPVNVTTAMAMVSLGAHGETAKQIDKALRFKLQGNMLHGQHSSVLADLARRTTPPGGGEFGLYLANSVWVREGDRLLPGFYRAVRGAYGVRPESLDFASNPEGSRKTINDWVEKQTHGKITDLLRPENVTPQTQIILASAIYFKSLWANPFPESGTRDDDFQAGPGGKVRVKMMNQTASFPYFENDALQALALPYKDNDLSMIVILPRRAEGLGEIEASMTLDTLESWIGKLAPRKVKVSLPRFKSTGEFNLKDALSSMGMPIAFEPGKADFSEITGKRDFCISAVVHKAFVEVEERGTEAAAATAVVGVRASLALLPEPVFRADHPFLYMIRDNQSGTILFEGRLVKP